MRYVCVVWQERSASAPSGAVRGGLAVSEDIGGLPAIYIDTGTGAASPDSDDSHASNANSFFVTEAPPPPVTRKSVPAATPTQPPRTAPPHLTRLPPALPPASASRPQRDQTPNRAEKKSAAGNRGGIISSSKRGASSYALGRQNQSQKRGEKSPEGGKPVPLSVRFADSAGTPHQGGEREGEGGAGLGGREGLHNAGLEAKVRTFLDDVTQFTSARRQGRQAARRPDLWGTEKTMGEAAPPYRAPSTPGGASSSLARGSTPHTPVVARRYNTWSVDQGELLAAFDQFCLAQSRDELARVVRLAAKMKAGVRVTRNQSIVPSMAAFRGTRAFKALVGR